MDPTLTCVHTPDPAKSHQKVDYTITFGNPNPTPLTSVKVTVFYPSDSGITFESALDGGYLNGTTVIWNNLGTLPGGGTRTLSLSLRAPMCYTLLPKDACGVEVTITSDSTSPVKIFDFTRFQAWNSLECTIGSPPSVALGTHFSYAITIINNCEITVTSVRFRAGLSEHVTFLSASNLGVFSPGGGAGGTVRWEFVPLSLGPGEAYTFTVMVKVNSNAPVGTNNLQIRVFELLTDESWASKGSFEAYTSVTNVDPTIPTCIHTPDPARYGQKVNYTITFANPNPVPMTSIKVTFYYKPNPPVKFESASDGGYLVDTTVIWDNLGVLAPRGSRTLSLSLRAPVGVMTQLASVDYIGKVTVTSGTTSPVTVEDYTRVLPWENLDCTIDHPPSVGPGDQFVYSINIINNCEIVVTSVRFEADLSEYVTFVSASDLGSHYWSGSGAGGRVSWSYMPWSLNPGLAKAVTITVKVNSDAPPGTNSLMFRVYDLRSDESASSKASFDAYISVFVVRWFWIVYRYINEWLVRLSRIWKRKGTLT